MGFVRPSSPDDTTGPAPVEIRVFAHRRVALRYHALAFVPLPGDDANLHCPGYVRAWRLRLADDGDALDGLEALIEAARLQLAAGPGRLAPQADVLAAPTRPPADDALGRLESFLAPSHGCVWEEALDAVEACRLTFGKGLQHRRRLFAALQVAGLERLDVHLCPSLRAAGRAVRGGSAYTVAIPLPDDEVVDRRLHNSSTVLPPAADDVIAPSCPRSRATARGSAGHTAHTARGRGAGGRQALDAATPGRDLLPGLGGPIPAAERLAERLDAALDLPKAARAPLLARAADRSRDRRDGGSHT